MSVDDLMARIDAARDRLRESREEALAATGALKGIYMAREQIGNLLKPPPLPPLEERLRGGGSSRGASFAAGRINEQAWREHYEHRARFEGGRVVTEAAWKDPVTGKNLPFSDARSRRLDFVYSHPNGEVDALEHKKSSLTATSRTAEAQRARDQIAMSRGAQIGKKSEGFLSNVDNVVYKTGLPLLGPGGNTDLPGAGERPTHVHIDPQDGKTFLRSVLRGGSRALGPLGAAVDLYYLGDAIAEDGGTFGENTKTTVGGMAGGWGGAAAGAAIGSLIFPGVGTVVGGIVGGIGGGLLGESIGERL
jgi:hypothetical protein